MTAREKKYDSREKKQRGNDKQDYDWRGESITIRKESRLEKKS